MWLSECFIRQVRPWAGSELCDSFRELVDVWRFKLLEVPDEEGVSDWCKV